MKRVVCYGLPGFALGVVCNFNDLWVMMVFALALIGFCVFIVLLLFCLSEEKERADVAEAAVVEWQAECKTLKETSEQIVALSQEMVETRKGILVGDRTVMEMLVEQARAAGADIEYVPTDDLEAL